MSRGDFPARLYIFDERAKIGQDKPLWWTTITGPGSIEIPGLGQGGRTTRTLLIFPSGAMETSPPVPADWPWPPDGSPAPQEPSS